MSANEKRQAIQEMEQGEKDFGIVNTAKSLHKKIVNNQLVSEFDAFSVPVKLTLNGEEQYKTCCGGFMYLILVGFCVLLTWVVVFPNGIQLNSQLNVVMIPHDSGDTGQTLFDNTDEIFSFRGLRKNSTAIIGYENISRYVTLKVYQLGTDNTTIPLEISTDCSQGNEFCLKNTQANKNAKIFGNFIEPNTFSKYIFIEAIWCNTSVPAQCPTYTRYSMQMTISNFYKKKGGDFQQYRIKNIFPFSNSAYSGNVTREQFTTNNRFRGHLSNILPFMKQSYLFNTDLTRRGATIASLKTPGTFTSRRFFQYVIYPYGTTKQINQNFDDISDVLLFFLSVKETLYILLFVIFIKQYNRNSGLLDVGSSLFYIDNPKTKMKYNFNRGFDVFVACLFHNHPVTNLIQFIMTKMGRTLEDFFPAKAFCAIKLMAKAEEILQQNAFYGNLNELSSMEGQASRKIPLVQEEKSQQIYQEIEMSYFPILPGDCQVQKRQKEMKREAFKQFCQANEHLSPQRKNFIYKVLTQNRLKYALVHEIQTDFKQFLRNVRIQMSDDIYRQVEEEEFSQIKVAVHDSSSQHMTAHNFIRT